MEFWKSLAAVLVVSTSLSAATYYVDFVGGKDVNDGVAQASAFQHAPGDTAATDNAAKVKLEPGDTVILKGGVAYRGSITIGASGVDGKSITYDGNSTGMFGQGKAIIDGAQPIGGWKKFANADEALGNPNWQNLLYTDDVSAKADVLSMHLSQGERMMYIAQSPTGPDLFWWDSPKFARPAPAPPQLDADVHVEPKDGRKVTANYAWQNLIDGTKSPVYLNPADGAELVVTLPDAVTVERFAFSYGIDDARITQMTLIGDGKEILSQKISAEENGKKQVELKPAQAATFKTLTIRVDSHDPGTKNLPSVRIGEFEAFDAKGVNVFRSAKAAESTLADPEFLNQTDPAAWAGATVAILGKPMKFYFAPINTFEPAEHRLRFKMINAQWYTPSKYVILNAPRSLTHAGQFVLWRGADGKAKPRLIVWPFESASFEREAQIATRASGIAINGDHVTVKGFVIQNLAGDVSAIASTGHHHLTIDGNTIRRLRGNLGDRQATVSLKEVADFTITHNEIHDNIKCIGLIATKSERGVVSGNTIRRNGDTLTDFYTCRDIKVIGNTLAESAGHHANGFTFYLNNANVLVENNRILCNRPITFHSIEGITIRNNVLDSMGEGNCISIWASNVAASNNVTIEHNTMVNAQPDSFEAGIYRGDGKGKNLVIRNNIIDGLGGVWGKDGVTLENNLFLRTGKGVTADELGVGGFVVDDLSKIFIDPAKADYRLKDGSPAIGKAKGTQSPNLGASPPTP